MTINEWVAEYERMIQTLPEIGLKVYGEFTFNSDAYNLATRIHVSDSLVYENGILLPPKWEPWETGLVCIIEKVTANVYTNFHPDVEGVLITAHPKNKKRFVYGKLIFKGDK